MCWCTSILLLLVIYVSAFVRVIESTSTVQVNVSSRRQLHCWQFMFSDPHSLRRPKAASRIRASTSIASILLLRAQRSNLPSVGGGYFAIYFKGSTFKGPNDTPAVLPRSKRGKRDRTGPSRSFRRSHPARSRVGISVLFTDILLRSIGSRRHRRGAHGVRKGRSDLRNRHRVLAR